MRLAISLFVLGITAPLAAQTAGSLWPSARAGHVMVYDPVRGETVLIGGDANEESQIRDSVWAWSGVAWRVSGVPGPSWRTLPAAAFDSRRGRLVLHGGIRKNSAKSYGATESDTWEWDGARWEQRSVAGPGPMDHHVMVFDEARGVMVVQGGGRDMGMLPGETWTYDGTTWTRVADSVSGPGPRAHHAMTYDARRERVVLYGGVRGSNPRRLDTWEWDGRVWARVDTLGPNVGGGHRMAYDAARGVTLLFGGNDVGETWSWNGTRWAQLARTGPPLRNVFAMAYDTRRARVVLYGGGSMRSDLWEWDGERWGEISRR